MKSLTINKELVIGAPIAKVFSALTSSEQIPKYYPLNSVESDWIVGSPILNKGEANGVPFTDFGVITELSKSNAFAYEYWSDNHGTERNASNNITISYVLEEISQGTLLKLCQSNIRSAELFEVMSSQVWDYLLDSLRQYAEAERS
jgi:uncharacterized protein YndB with AHSA1/START domain